MISKWIKVDDRLPANGVYVICTNNNHLPFITMYICGGFGIDSKKVSHWMPLPCPPE